MSSVASIESTRLQLEPLTLEEGEALLRGDRSAHSWAPDFPTDGDLRQATILRNAPQRAVSPANPWGPYTLVEKSTGLAIGGIGFKGHPDARGAVEIGYGICSSRQGQGLMSEAVARLSALARSLGANCVTAETDASNAASQRVLQKSGFDQVSAENGSIWWRLELSEQVP